MKAYVMRQSIRSMAAMHILSARSVSTVSELDRGRPGNAGATTAPPQSSTHSWPA